MKSIKALGLIFLVVIILWNHSWLPKPESYADSDATNGILLSMSTDVATVKSGRSFTYTVSFSFSDLVSHGFGTFSDMKLVLPLPAGVEFENFIPISVIDPSVQQVGNDLIFSFVPGAPTAGSTYNLQVNAHFTAYTTLNGTVGSTAAMIIDTNGATPTPPYTSMILDTSNTVNVTAEAAANWTLLKEKVSPLPEPVVDGEVQYRILFDNNQSNTNIGVLDIENVVLTDFLPPEAVFVSASPAPTTAPAVGSTGAVTWSLPGTVRNDTIFYVTVKYPSANIPIVSHDVTNLASVDYTALGNPTVVNKTSQVTHHFTNTLTDTGPGGFTKSVDSRQQEISPGQDVTFYVGGFRNWSNGVYEDAFIQDMTPISDTMAQPVDFDLKSITTAAFHDASVTYSVYYTTTSTPTAGDWVLWDEVSSTVPDDLYVADLGLGAGTHVMGVEYRFPQDLPVSFSQESDFISTYTLRAGSAIVNGHQIENVAKLSYVFNGATKVKTDNALVGVWGNRPLVRIDKSRVGGGPLVPTNDATDSFVSFDIQITNTDLSSDAFDNPIVIDKLPKWLTYDSWSVVTGSSVNFDPQASGHAILMDPALTIAKNGAGETLLRWIFPPSTNMPINSSFTIRVKAKIDKYTPATTYTNLAGVTSNVDAYINDYYFDPDVDSAADYDNDGSTADIFLYDTADVTVNKVAELSSYKRVRGELDNDWKTGALPDGCTIGNSSCDELANTTEGGRVDYKLTVKNNSNFDVDHIVVVDSLPRIGDEGALLGARGSTWGTVLTAPLAANPNYTVFYNTETHVKFSTSTGWSTTPPDDLTTVTALKFDFVDSYTLAPGASLPIQWTMMAPVGTSVDTIAWNSFAHQAAEAGGGATMQPAEPPKVGVHIAPDTGIKLGNYVWVDLDQDGIQDAGEPGVNGVKVALYESDGTTPFTKDFDDDGVTVHIPVTTVTGPDQSGKAGYYLFPNLHNGNYKVKFTLPTALPEDYTHTGDGDPYVNPANLFMAWTQKNAGTDDEIDSNVGGAGTTSTMSPFTTDVVTLTTLDDLTIDAGIAPPLGAIGDFVWYDADGDGIQDGGEAGIPGVNVNLYKETVPGTWTNVGTDTTDASGNYEFTGLLPGKYKVSFPGNAGYDTNADTVDENVILTFRHKGSNRTKDSNAYDVASAAGYDFPADIGNSKPYGFSEVINLQLGEIDHHVDAGYVLPVKLGDQVWYDGNADGVQGGGSDTDASGVKVHLLDGSGTSVKGTNGNALIKTTPANGQYLFDNLLPGTYKVQFDLPTGYGFTRKGQGGNAALDSNVNRSANNAPTLQTTGQTDNISTVGTPGASDLTIDAGLVKLVSLGDYVWMDKDEDGVQDAAESGVSGVAVKLYYDSDSTTTVYRSATTSGTGAYTFGNLYPGNYSVEFTRPAGYLFTGKQLGGDATKDSDANVPAVPTTTTAKTDQIAMLATDNPNIDAGLVQLASVGDLIWLDEDDDGVQDAGEPPLAGVKVDLLNSGGTPIAKDAYDDDITTVTTGADGLYGFDDLLPGAYKVRFTLPNGYWFAKLNQGADDAKDSDAVAQTPADPDIGIEAVTLSAGEDDLSIDAGALPLAAIADFVWHDVDGDGFQDTSGEPGKANVKVELFEADGTTAVTKDALGNPISPTTTDATGFYEFVNLKEGDYKVKFSNLPTGYVFTTKATAAADKDSDANEATGMTDTIHIDWGERNEDVDAGLVDRMKLGDFVWYDADGDGEQDAGETGVNNVLVELYETSNLTTPLKTTHTANDGTGKYEFNLLWPGDYVVKFVLPSDYYIFSPDLVGATGTDSDADPTTGKSAVVTLVSGVNDMTIDAGIVELVSIGDKLWDDRNDDGIQNGTPAESGYAGVTVHLLDSAGSPIQSGGTDVTTVTNASGNYLFEKLLPGDYKVKFDLPAGYMFAKKNAVGSSAANDSNVDPTSGVSDTISLPPGTHDMTVDAGIVKLSSIGDYVWMDADLDGVQDAGEAAVSGVVANLLDEFGNPVLSGGVPMTDTTDASGIYGFTNLVPGKYRVQFDPSPAAEYAITRQGEGTAATGSDADTTTRRTGVVTLAPGENNVDVDAGLVKLVDLGDKVWIDTGIIGFQESEPAGAAASGVTVRLLDGDGDPVFSGGLPVTTTTDANGNYVFQNLFPGVYKVKFDLTTGYLFTRKNVTGTGITTAGDSNVDKDGFTDAVTLVAGNDDMTVDAGIVLPASLGDYVWEDMNGDGKQDPTEKGRNGVKVELFDGDGTLLETATTADKAGIPGYYSFTNLVPGPYKVKFTEPAGYMFSTKQVPAAGAAADSDAGLNGDTDVVTLTAGENNATIDAGVHLIPQVLFGSLGNYVWIDENDDGIQDADETGLNGVTVELYNRYGIKIDSQTTKDDYRGKSGYYLFINLSPDEYSVKFVLPQGYAYSRALQGGDAALDSNAGTDGKTGTIVIHPNEHIVTIDAGLIRLASLGDYVWIDADANGRQDTGEQGLNGVEVGLYDEQGHLVQSRVTGNGPGGTPGYYLFENLKPGKYYAKFELPKDYAFSKPKATGVSAAINSDARADGTTELVSLASGDRVTTIDAGLVSLDAASPPATDKGDEDGKDADEGSGNGGGKTPIKDNGGKTPTKGDGNDGKSGTPTNPGGDTKSNNAALPKTGETPSRLPYFGFGLLFLGALLLVARIRKQSKSSITK